MQTCSEARLRACRDRLCLFLVGLGHIYLPPPPPPTPNAHGFILPVALTAARSFLSRWFFTPQVCNLWTSGSAIGRFNGMSFDPFNGYGQTCFADLSSARIIMLHCSEHVWGTALSSGHPAGLKKTKKQQQQQTGALSERRAGH